MEKSNSRNRRGGKGPESGSPTTNDATQAPVTTKKWEPPEIGPGQDDAEQTSTGTRTGSTARQTARGLQDTFIDERNDVLAVINELEDQLDRHQEIRETLERELTGTSENLQNANQRVQELEWQVVTLQTRVDALEQLRTDVASLEEELGDANGRLQRTNEQLAATDKERARLKNELKAANKQVDELWPVRKERDGLKSECKMLSTKVDELERNQRELIEERGHLQSQLHEHEITLEETTTERNKLQMTLRGAEDRIRELASVQEALDDKIESLRAEKKNLQVQMTHLERENTRLVEQRQFYECEVTSLRNHSRTAESALTSVKKAFSEVRVALTETKSRARRRALDSWPRVGSPLRGLGEEEMHDRGGVDIPIAATIGAEAEAATEDTAGQTETPSDTQDRKETGQENE
jgi:chromosome segregation ATPase